jgi:hypothetical protein
MCGAAHRHRLPYIRLGSFRPPVQSLTPLHHDERWQWVAGGVHQHSIAIVLDADNLYWYQIFFHIRAECSQAEKSRSRKYRGKVYIIIGDSATYGMP